MTDTTTVDGYDGYWECENDPDHDTRAYTVCDDCRKRADRKRRMTTTTTTHPCNCENTLCGARTHIVTSEQFSRCPNNGKYAVQFVGAICGDCAAYMPTRYGREPTTAEVHAYGFKALREFSE